MNQKDREWIKRCSTNVKPITLFDIDEEKILGNTYFTYALSIIGHVGAENRIIYCTNLKDLEDCMMNRSISPRIRTDSDDALDILAEQYLQHSRS